MTEDHTEWALRRALDDAARHVDVHAGSLPEPSFEPAEQPHRRRLAVAVGVAVVVALIAGSFAFVATRDEGSSSVEIGEPTADPITKENAELQVFMKVDASESEIEAVRDLLEADPGVAAYTAVDKEQASREFQVAATCVKGPVDSHAFPEFAESFRIRLLHDAAGGAVFDRLTLPGVASVVVRPDLLEPVSGEGHASATREGETSPAVGQPTTTTPVTATVPRASKEIPFVLPAPPDCREEQTTVTTVTPAPTTTVVGQTLPPAGDAPVDRASAEAAVRDVWNKGFSASTPEAERWSAHEVFENHPELIGGGLPQNQQYRDNSAVKVLDVVFVSPTRAAVRYQLEFPALRMTQPPDIGYAVLTDHGWRIATETTCALMALGSRPCPAGT